MSTPQFTTGLAHMQAAIDEGQRKAAAAGGAGKNLHFINWKDGDTKVLRFLTDDVLTENFADFIVNKNGETSNFMIPAHDPHILDRYRSATPGIGWQKQYGSGQLTDQIKLRKIGVGIAVLRAEPTGEPVQDYLYDQEIDGKNYLSRHFGIVQQSISNFWQTLAVSCFKRYGTICDRDYAITRIGADKNTKYSIIPLDPDPDLRGNTVEETLAKVHQFYFYGYKWDEQDPQRFLKCPQTLTQWAENFSGEDRFKFWLTPEGGVAPQQASFSPKTTTTMPNPLTTTVSGPVGAAVLGGSTAVHPALQKGWSGDGSDPMSEFHASTTQNPPEVAKQTTGTNFSSFKEELLRQAKGND